MAHEETGREGETDPDGERPVDASGLVNWLLAGIVVAIVAAYAYRFVVPGGAAALVDHPAPAFQVEKLGGDGPVDISDYRGDVVVMDFWATWCPPCHEQMKYIRELGRRTEGERDLTILLVNVDESGPDRVAKVRTYLKRRRLSFPTLLDDGTVQRKYNISSYPTLVVVGPEGTVRFAESGIHETQELVELVERIGE